MSHQELRQNLPALAAGRLEGEARIELERHVAECASCSETLSAATELASALRSEDPEPPGPHPDVLTLRRFARGAGGPETSDIAGHVEKCPCCSIEVAAWKAHLARRWAPSQPPLRKRPSLSLASLAAGALAAGLVLGILLRPLLPFGPPPAPAADSASGEVRILEFSGAFRGAREEASIASGERLIVVVDLAGVEQGEPGPLKFEIARLDPGGAREIWSAQADAGRVQRSLRAGEKFAFDVPRLALAPGEHELRAIEARRPYAPPLLQQRFRVLEGSVPGER